MLAFGLVAAAGCAADRPRMPPRIIDDPATLPVGLVWLAGAAQVNSMVQPATAGGWNHSEGAEFRPGVTKRLEVVDFLALRRPVLDDSPTRTDPDALTFAIKAGLGNAEVGDDFIADSDLVPVVRLDAGKRVATRLRLGGVPRSSARACTTAGHIRTRRCPRPAWRACPRLERVGGDAGRAAGLSLDDFTRAGGDPPPRVDSVPELWLDMRPRRWLTLGAKASLVLAWADSDRPPANPERSAAEARALFVEPRYRILILGA